MDIRLPRYNSERPVPLPDQLLEILAAHLELGHPSEWLCAGAEDTPPHQNMVGHRWRTTLRRAGIDVVTVQRALGHAKATTTLETYSHLWPTAEDRTRSAAAAVSARVLGPGEGSMRAEGPTRPLTCGVTR